MERIIPSWNAFSNSCRLILLLELAAGRQCWGPPVSGTSLLVATAPLLRITLSLSTPMDTSSAPSPPVSSSVPTTQSTNTNKHWKHYQDNLARSILNLSQSRQRSSPESSFGKVFSWSRSSNFKFAAGSTLFTTATNWLSGRFSDRIIHWNTTRWRSQLLLICAHMKTNLTDGTTGQCEILIKS